MKPQETYNKLQKDNFPLLIRGDNVFTNNHTSKLARLIRLKAKLKGNEPICNHEELYLYNGKCIGANKKVEIGGLDRFFKGNHDIYIFRDKTLSVEQRNNLVLEAIGYFGTSYDTLGIVWQGLDAITKSTFFSRMFNKKRIVYCSEFIQRITESALQKNPSLSEVGVGTPNDSLLYKTFSEDFECVFMMRKNALGNWETL